MTQIDEPIHLRPHDPEWPKLFAAEARRVCDGQSTNVGIEHVGSPSVSGLLAKPIIDIMLGVDSEDGLELVRKRLVVLGYEDCGEAGVPGPYIFAEELKTISTWHWLSEMVRFGAQTSH
jgi:GrpB-like predicted nucleotidyltransferase (UPF0157 family)